MMSVKSVRSGCMRGGRAEGASVSPSGFLWLSVSLTAGPEPLVSHDTNPEGCDQHFTKG